MPIIKSYGYNVVIESGNFKSLSKFLRKNKFSSVFILCDENTMRHCMPVLISGCPELSQAEVIELESGEANKSIEISAMIWQTLLEKKADKNTLIVNLGGGVISDLGGFVASIYKRGIAFIHLPTSLLAMADASVGGKTAIDFLSVKNVIGTFAQPKGVFIHSDFLKTLPERHLRNGLAEIYKIALVSDKNLWKELKQDLPIDHLIHKSITLKNKIVLKDPFDNGLRKILNFGHSVGHALEALKMDSGDELLHGEAIAIGMVIECHLALQKKLISKALYTEITTTLSGAFRLSSILELPFTAIMDLINNDKKSSGEQARFALIHKIGGCRTDVIMSGAQLKKALDAYNLLVNA